MDLQINTANVSTYGDRVVDIFYVKNAFGSKIEDDSKIEKVRNCIFNILEELDPVNPILKPWDKVWKIKTLFL